MTAGAASLLAARWRSGGLWALRLAVAALFLVAGALKMRDPSAFAQEVANYQLLPELAPFVAILLPPTEIVAALALVLGPPAWRRAGALALALLAALFTGAVAAAAGRGLDISCACFGQGSGNVSWLTVGRNLLLTAAAGALVWLEGRNAHASDSSDRA